MTPTRYVFMTIFTIVLLSLTVSLHLYIWWAFKQAFPILETRAKWLKRVLIFLSVSGPMAYVIFRFYTPAAPLVIIFVTWTAFALLFAFILGMSRLSLRLKFYLMGQVNSDRRLFLQKATSVIALGGTSGAAAYGIHEALEAPRVKEVEVRLKKWPEALAGFKIVQITDLHVGPTIKRKYVEAVVEKINALDADIVALTGDLVDGPVSYLEKDVEPLGQLKAKLGRFMVTGNHEYYSGVLDWIDKFQSLGVRVLRNENLRIESQGAAFNLAGVDDYMSKDMVPGHGMNHSAALESRDANLATVLLAHQPRGFFEAAKFGIDLQISGHTHGGQVWPFGFFVSFVQPFVKGLHYHDESCIYVSCGTGFWGPAMRVNAPSEITLIKIYPI